MPDRDVCTELSEIGKLMPMIVTGGHDELIERLEHLLIAAPQDRELKTVVEVGRAHVLVDERGRAPGRLQPARLPARLVGGAEPADHERASFVPRRF